MTDIGRERLIVMFLFAACSSGNGGGIPDTGARPDTMSADAPADRGVPVSNDGPQGAPETGEDLVDLGGTVEADTAPEDAAQPADGTATDTASGEDAPLEVGPDTSAPPEIGSPCTAETDCPAGGSGTPACQTDWPGGYCLVVACAAHGHDCPGDAGLGGTEGSKCVKAPDLTCLALCGSAADCREGYDCVAKPDAAGHGSVTVCYPK